MNGWWWKPWSPADVTRRLHSVKAPWYVAGGWALDLWLGRVTRPHDDLEIAVPARSFGQVHKALAGFAFWRPAPDSHQTWVRDPHSGAYVLDVFREQHDGDTWICRRDPMLRRPYRDIVRRTPQGVPYVVPEIVLLFKAKYQRPKDHADLAAALPALSGGQRAWLHERLPDGHPWRELTRPPG